MSVLRLCEHQLDLLVRAVAAYKPANDEKDDYNLLVDYLAAKARDDAFWDEELRPEDIPF